MMSHAPPKAIFPGRKRNYPPFPASFYNLSKKAQVPAICVVTLLAVCKLPRKPMRYPNLYTLHQ